MAVTIRDVARLAGASVASVSATLNGTTSTTRVSAATRLRIQDAAAQLGYVSNAVAQSLATGRTGTVGLMLPYADAFFGHDPFSLTVMRGVMRCAVNHHLNVMLYSATGGMSESRVAMMIDKRVDGLLLVMPEEGGAVLTKLERRGIPFVSVLRRRVEDSWTVNSDDYAGARMATEHLLRLGHTRLLHLQGNPSIVTMAPRLQGFLDATREGSAHGQAVRAGFDWKDGYREAMAIFSEKNTVKPTAILAANDFCAQGVLLAFDELGIRVPDDVALVGYDDTTLAETTRPRLTSVHMGVEEMGFLALELLAAQIENRDVPDRQPVQPVRLTVRESCGAQVPVRVHRGEVAADAPTTR